MCINAIIFAIIIATIIAIPICIRFSNRRKHEILVDENCNDIYIITTNIVMFSYILRGVCKDAIHINTDENDTHLVSFFLRFGENCMHMEDLPKDIARDFCVTNVGIYQFKLKFVIGSMDSIVTSTVISNIIDDEGSCILLLRHNKSDSVGVYVVSKGKVDGNSHTIKNIRSNPNGYGLLYYMLTGTNAWDNGSTSIFSIKKISYNMGSGRTNTELPISKELVKSELERILGMNLGKSYYWNNYEYHY